MKLTKTQALFGVGIGVLLIAGALWFFRIFSPLTTPKDTPIVVVGGSIYGQTDPSDTDGWTSSGTSFSASLHSSGDNPKKTDQLYLKGFQLNGAALFPDPYPVSASGGWKIEYFNQDQKHVKQKDAMYLCSNATCSTCNSAAGDSVYLLPGGHGRLQPRKNGSKVTNEIHFHDKACDGDNDTEDPVCDKIISIVLTTCNGTSTEYECPSSASGHCNVQVGNK